ncbi:MAG: hypothetical protein ABH871_02745 [Pseudomonadota bacterium]
MTRKKIQKNNSNCHPRIDTKNEIITKQKLVPFFENLKEFIISTVKGSESVLRKEIQGVRKELKADIEITQLALKSTKEELKTDIKELRKEVKADMHDMETRLSNKIDNNNSRLENHEKRITALEVARA